MTFRMISLRTLAVIFLTLALLLCGMRTVADAAVGTVKIQDNGTGGDCSSVGVWNQYLKTCTLTTDLTFSGTNGIEIISHGITLDGNGHAINGSGGFATGGSLSVKNNVTMKNLTVRNFGFGIYMLASHGNTVRGNTIENNDVGLKIVASNNNTIYGNSFVNNNTQAVAQGGFGNVFNLTAPTGGNYWSNWAQPDSDNDGFVDSPYFFTGGVDNLPLAGSSSCTVGKPAVVLRLLNSHWKTMADYQVGRLSVDYSLANIDVMQAFGSRVTGSINSNGVVVFSIMPIGVGDLGGDTSLPFTIKYTVPPGVSAFRASLTATAADDCGNWYTYP